MYFNIAIGMEQLVIGVGCGGEVLGDLERGTALGVVVRGSPTHWTQMLLLLAMFVGAELSAPIAFTCGTMVSLLLMMGDGPTRLC